VTDGVRMRLAATVLDAPDARELAGFYRRLLGWEVAEDEADWVMLRAPDGETAGSGVTGAGVTGAEVTEGGVAEGGTAEDGGAGGVTVRGAIAGDRAAEDRAAGGQAALSFQTERDYVPPVWPAGPGDPQMSMHLDFEVDDLEAAAAHAVAAGARLAGFQPQDDVRVFLDPAGHPFCLFRLFRPY
jgi:catechol 2,3-dioxygenase-like lactoylglutathione lyase family enzyme